MDEKTVKNLLDVQTKTIDDKLAVQTKHIDGKLATQTKDIEGKIAAQTKEMQRHQQMLLEEFDSRLKVVAEVQIDHTKKFDALFEMVALNTEQLEMIKGMLKRKVDFEEYEKLEKRVSTLEKKLRISGMQT